MLFDPSIDAQGSGDFMSQNWRSYGISDNVILSAAKNGTTGLDCELLNKEDLVCNSYLPRCKKRILVKS